MDNYSIPIFSRSSFLSGSKAFLISFFHEIKSSYASSASLPPHLFSREKVEYITSFIDWMPYRSKILLVPDAAFRIKGSFKDGQETFS